MIFLLPRSSDPPDGRFSRSRKLEKLHAVVLPKVVPVIAMYSLGDVVQRSTAVKRMTKTCRASRKVNCWNWSSCLRVNWFIARMRESSKVHRRPLSANWKGAPLEGSNKGSQVLNLPSNPALTKGTFICPSKIINHNKQRQQTRKNHWIAKSRAKRDSDLSIIDIITLQNRCNVHI